MQRVLQFIVLVWLTFPTTHGFSATFSVASYNLEFYFEQPVLELNASAKSAESKSKIRETLRSLNADVVALQEMGTPAALAELQASLHKEGVDYKYKAIMAGPDQALHLAFLSKFPIVRQHRFTNENYLLRGKRHQVARGFFAIEVAPSEGRNFTILNNHFKSKRQVFEADDSEMREQEATQLQARVEKLLHPSRRNLIVVGDLNDGIESKTLRIIQGRGANALHDVRPTERNGDTGFRRSESDNPRSVAWTHYFGRDETYSRIDYILVPKELLEKLDRTETYIATIPDWGIGSDHRAIKATFIY